MAKSLYFWVLIAIFAGAAFGYFEPEAAIQLKWVADAFVKIIKWIAVPIVFCTVALGISGAEGAKQAGRLGIKSFIYFEMVSTLALILGLVVANVFKPGASFHGAMTPANLDLAKSPSAVQSGGMLPVLILALAVGFILRAKDRARLNWISVQLFKGVGTLMRLAPIAAGSAMAYTIGRFGSASFLPLMNLMLCMYLTSILFVFGVLGWIARRFGFSIWKLLQYLKDELLTVLGTSSSESVLASLIEKLVQAGCDRATVGFVIPTGYSFNLDGTSLYITIAGIFITQAMGVDLSLGQQLEFVGIAILTSKGAAGITGSGFASLAATLALFPSIPIAGLSIILGVDRFMSEARAITNTIGNAVAAVVLSKSENKFVSMSKF